MRAPDRLRFHWGYEDATFDHEHGVRRIVPEGDAAHCAGYAHGMLEPGVDSGPAWIAWCYSRVGVAS